MGKCEDCSDSGHLADRIAGDHRAKDFWNFPSRWVAEHTAYDPPKMFEDVQIAGPFKSWRHKHFIEPHPNGAMLRDEIDFEPPFSIFGQLGAVFVILPKLEKMFEYRHRVTKEWCESFESSASS